MTMINEYLQMLLGAYHEFVPDTYGNREYFDSVICVMGLGGLILTGCVIMGIVAHTMYKSLFRGVR